MVNKAKHAVSSAYISSKMAAAGYCEQKENNILSSKDGIFFK